MTLVRFQLLFFGKSFELSVITEYPFFSVGSVTEDVVKDAKVTSSEGSPAELLFALLTNPEIQKENDQGLLSFEEFKDSDLGQYLFFTVKTSL